ncbi:MAG: internal scaffolding protein [Wigfec virus K19_179]|nr:MAG: internal scaffolding protein [Wigfec virus K19_179]
MKFQTRYETPLSVQVDQTGQKSLTVQSEKDSCDINKIMERFDRTGKLPSMQVQPPRYGDARVVDFQTAQQIVREAKDQFNALPSKTRKAFGNDPQAFLEAIQDNSEENAKALLKLGILIPRKATPEEVLTQIAINTAPAEKTAETK